jgi:hypothetical protein
MQLTDKEIKILNKFSNYVESHNTNIVYKTIHVSSGKQMDKFMGEEWTFKQNHINRSIESFESIDNIIQRFIHENEDMLDYYSESSGFIEVILNTSNKTIQFKINYESFESVNIAETDETIDEDHPLWNWFKEMLNDGYKWATVNFSGGGDEGYVEDHMETSENRDIIVPDFVDNWINDDISYDYVNNEGGQGDYHFDFVENTILANWEQNEYQTQEVLYDNIIKF